MKKLLLIALLLASVCLVAQNVRVDGVISSRYNNPAAGASIAVCMQPATPLSVAPYCSPLAPLCVSLTDASCNASAFPVTSDGLGNYHFYVGSGGPYTYCFYGATLTASCLPDQQPPLASGSLLTAPGIFTNLHNNESGLQILVNGASGNYYHAIGLYPGYVTEVISAAINVPASATVEQINAVSGYALDSCDSLIRTVCNTVAGFFRADAAGLQSGIWGLNTNVADAPGVAQTNETGYEDDVGVGGTPNFVNGINIVLSPSNGGFGTMPFVGPTCLSCGAAFVIGAINPVLQWEKAIDIQDASFNSSFPAIEIGATSQATSSSSGSIGWVYYDSTDTRQEVTLAANSAGGLNLNAPAFVLNGAHLDQAATKTFAGTCAMSTSTSCTFTILATYNVTPICVVNSQAATAIAAACFVSGTTVTVTAASSNSQTWGAVLIGNPT